MKSIAIMNSGQQLTMSSREIAELTGRRHDNVMTLCRSMRDMRVCPEIQETPYTNDQNGQTYLECRLNKRDSLVLIARISPEFTAKVVDRWQELEEKQARPAELSRMEILQIAMEAEQGRLLALEQRDEAIRTKAEIGSRREATAMATASAKAREVARLKSELGRNQAHATVKAVEKMTRRAFGKQGWRPLRDYCIEHGLESRNVVDEQYGTVKAWPAMAWRAVYGIDLETLFPVGEE